MIPNDFKTSLRIPSQLPEFIRDDLNYETFVAFVEAYYEWLELANTANANTTIASTSGEGVTYASKNLSNYYDVDSTLDGFLSYFVNDFLPYFPEESRSNKALTLKIARQLYQSKGTPASYKLLFRLFYNSDVEILLTRDLVFRASDGEWYLPKSLKIKADNEFWLLKELQGLKVFGETSKSFATIESVFVNGGKYDVFISNIERVFKSGEILKVVNSQNQDVYVYNNEIVPSTTVGASTITAKLVGTIDSIRVDVKHRGSRYTAGDPVVIYGGLDSAEGVGASAIVGSTSSGSVTKFNVISGGYGYRVAPNTRIDITGGGGAIAHVSTIDPINDNLTVNIPIDEISTYGSTLLSSTDYGFSNIASANANTKLSDALIYESFVVSPISSVLLDYGGGGYNSIPEASAESLYPDDLGNYQSLASLGSLGPIKIIDGGTGYTVNTRIIIDGGNGYGASANVTEVDINGSITSVEYVPYEKTSEIFPVGGIGYTLGDVRTPGYFSFAPVVPEACNTITTFNRTGDFELFEYVYQPEDASLEVDASGLLVSSNATFIAYITGVSPSNNSIQVYTIIQNSVTNPDFTDHYGNTFDTPNITSLMANTLLTGYSTGATINVSSSLIGGDSAIINIDGILGTGASFYIDTDTIGAVSTILITNYGEDYIETPNVSLRVQDLAVTGITDITSLVKGTIVFQGQDVDAASYTAYIDSASLLIEGTSVETSVYNLRVFNYIGYLTQFDPLDSANTVIQVNTEITPHPYMILTDQVDPIFGYTNGIKTYGDGNARASARFLNGLTYGKGLYLNTRGQPSSYSILQDYENNDFTYIISVSESISKYRDILRNLLHPAGTQMRGRDLLNNQKAFGVDHHSGTSKIKPLSYWANWPVGNPYVYATMNVSGIIANSMIKVIDGGTGYSPSTTVTIDAIDGRGTGATAVANIVDGVIVSIDVTDEGQNYILNPIITISDPTTRGGNSNASVSVSVDLSSNTMIIQNMNGGDIDSITQNAYWISVYPEQTGGNCKVYSTTKQYFNSNSTIILEDDTFLTFPNVIYGYANSLSSTITVSDISITNTPSYDIINSGSYSNTENHLEDIVFAGDNITVAGNTYVVQSVDYGSHQIRILGVESLLETQEGDLLETEGVEEFNLLTGAYLLSFGSEENPVPMTINRSISTSNVFIKELI